MVDIQVAAACSNGDMVSTAPGCGRPHSLSIDHRTRRLRCGSVLAEAEAGTGRDEDPGTVHSGRYFSGRSVAAPATDREDFGWTGYAMTFPPGNTGNHAQRLFNQKGRTA